MVPSFKTPGKKNAFPPIAGIKVSKDILSIISQDERITKASQDHFYGNLSVVTDMKKPPTAPPPSPFSSLDPTVTPMLTATPASPAADGETAAEAVVVAPPIPIPRKPGYQRYKELVMSANPSNAGQPKVRMIVGPPAGNAKEWRALVKSQKTNADKPLWMRDSDCVCQMLPPAAFFDATHADKVAFDRVREHQSSFPILLLQIGTDGKLASASRDPFPFLGCTERWLRRKPFFSWFDELVPGPQGPNSPITSRRDNVLFLKSIEHVFAHGGGMHDPHYAFDLPNLRHHDIRFTAVPLYDEPPELFSPVTAKDASKPPTHQFLETLEDNAVAKGKDNAMGEDSKEKVDFKIMEGVRGVLMTVELCTSLIYMEKSLKGLLVSLKEKGIIADTDSNRLRKNFMLKTKENSNTISSPILIDPSTKQTPESSIPAFAGAVPLNGESFSPLPSSESQHSSHGEPVMFAGHQSLVTGGREAGGTNKNNSSQQPLSQIMRLLTQLERSEIHKKNIAHANVLRQVKTALTSNLGGGTQMTNLNQKYQQTASSVSHIDNIPASDFSSWLAMEMDPTATAAQRQKTGIVERHRAPGRSSSLRKRSAAFLKPVLLRKKSRSRPGSQANSRAPSPTLSSVRNGTANNPTEFPLPKVPIVRENKFKKLNTGHMRTILSAMRKHGMTDSELTDSTPPSPSLTSQPNPGTVPKMGGHKRNSKSDMDLLLAGSLSSKAKRKNLSGNPKVGSSGGQRRMTLGPFGRQDLVQTVLKHREKLAFSLAEKQKNIEGMSTALAESNRSSISSKSFASPASSAQPEPDPLERLGVLHTSPTLLSSESSERASPGPVHQRSRSHSFVMSNNTSSLVSIQEEMKTTPLSGLAESVDLETLQDARTDNALRQTKSNEEITRNEAARVQQTKKIIEDLELSKEESTRLATELEKEKQLVKLLEARLQSFDSEYNAITVKTNEIKEMQALVSRLESEVESLKTCNDAEETKGEASGKSVDMLRIKLTMLNSKLKDVQKKKDELVMKSTESVSDLDFQVKLAVQISELEKQETALIIETATEDKKLEELNGGLTVKKSARDGLLAKHEAQLLVYRTQIVKLNKELESMEGSLYITVDDDDKEAEQDGKFGETNGFAIIEEDELAIEEDEDMISEECTEEDGRGQMEDPAEQDSSVPRASIGRRTSLIPVRQIHPMDLVVGSHYVLHLDTETEKAGVVGQTRDLNKSPESKKLSMNRRKSVASFFEDSQSKLNLSESSTQQNIGASSQAFASLMSLGGGLDVDLFGVHIGAHESEPLLWYTVMTPASPAPDADLVVPDSVVASSFDIWNNLPHRTALTTSPKPDPKSTSKRAKVMRASDKQPKFPFIRLSDPMRMFDDAVRTIHSWDEFDIFQVPLFTNGWPLCFVFATIFAHSGLANSLRDQYDPLTLAYFMQDIELHYFANPYHTSTHAADVVHAAYLLMQHSPLRASMPDLEVFCLLIAAAIHDVSHPGVNNAFLIDQSCSLAVIYNDKNVLENFHLATAFSLQQRPTCNFLKDFSSQDRAFVRKNIIQLVTVTDLAQHNSVLTEIKCSNMDLSVDADRLLAIKCVIKCGDISHPARAPTTHVKWSQLVTEEFYDQGDLESLLETNISMFMNRNTSNIPRSQVGFITYLVRDLFAEFTKWAGSDYWLQFVMKNLAMWEAIIQNEDKQKIADEAAGIVSPPKSTADTFCQYIIEAAAQFPADGPENVERIYYEELARAQQAVDAAPREEAASLEQETKRIIKENSEKFAQDKKNRDAKVKQEASAAAEKDLKARVEEKVPSEKTAALMTKLTDALSVPVRPHTPNSKDQGALSPKPQGLRSPVNGGSGGNSPSGADSLDLASPKGGAYGVALGEKSEKKPPGDVAAPAGYIGFNIRDRFSRHKKARLGNTPGAHRKSVHVEPDVVDDASSTAKD